MNSVLGKNAPIIIGVIVAAVLLLLVAIVVIVCVTVFLVRKKKQKENTSTERVVDNKDSNKPALDKNSELSISDKVPAPIEPITTDEPASGTESPRSSNKMPDVPEDSTAPSPPSILTPDNYVIPGISVKGQKPDPAIVKRNSAIISKWHNLTALLSIPVINMTLLTSVQNLDTQIVLGSGQTAAFFLRLFFKNIDALTLDDIALIARLWDEGVGYDYSFAHYNAFEVSFPAKEELKHISRSVLQGDVADVLHNISPYTDRIVRFISLRILLTHLNCMHATKTLNELYAKNVSDSSISDEDFDSAMLIVESRLQEAHENLIYFENSRKGALEQYNIDVDFSLYSGKRLTKEDLQYYPVSASPDGVSGTHFVLPTSTASSTVPTTYVEIQEPTPVIVDHNNKIINKWKNLTALLNIPAINMTFLRPRKINRKSLESAVPEDSVQIFAKFLRAFYKHVSDLTPDDLILITQLWDRDLPKRALYEYEVLSSVFIKKDELNHISRSTLSNLFAETLEPLAHYDSSIRVIGLHILWAHLRCVSATNILDILYVQNNSSSSISAEEFNNAMQAVASSLQASHASFLEFENLKKSELEGLDVDFYLYNGKRLTAEALQYTPDFPPLVSTDESAPSEHSITDESVPSTEEPTVTVPTEPNTTAELPNIPVAVPKIDPVLNTEPPGSPTAVSKTAPALSAEPPKAAPEEVSASMAYNKKILSEWKDLAARLNVPITNMNFIQHPQRLGGLKLKAPSQIFGMFLRIFYANLENLTPDDMILIIDLWDFTIPAKESERITNEEYEQLRSIFSEEERLKHLSPDTIKKILDEAIVPISSHTRDDRALAIFITVTKLHYISAMNILTTLERQNKPPSVISTEDFNKQMLAVESHLQEARDKLAAIEDIIRPQVQYTEEVIVGSEGYSHDGDSHIETRTRQLNLYVYLYSERMVPKDLKYNPDAHPGLLEPAPNIQQQRDTAAVIEDKNQIISQWRRMTGALHIPVANVVYLRDEQVHEIPIDGKMLEMIGRFIRVFDENINGLTHEDILFISRLWNKELALTDTALLNETKIEKIRSTFRNHEKLRHIDPSVMKNVLSEAVTALIAISHANSFDRAVALNILWPHLHCVSATHRLNWLYTQNNSDAGISDEKFNNEMLIVQSHLKDARGNWIYFEGLRPTRIQKVTTVYQKAHTTSEPCQGSEGCNFIEAYNSYYGTFGKLYLGTRTVNHDAGYVEKRETISTDSNIYLYSNRKVEAEELEYELYVPPPTPQSTPPILERTNSMEFRQNQTRTMLSRVQERGDRHANERNSAAALQPR